MLCLLWGCVRFLYTISEKKNSEQTIELLYELCEHHLSQAKEGFWRLVTTDC